MYYYLRKFIAMFFTIIIVTLITFFSFEIIPGDPVLSKLGIDADEAQIASLRAELGLDMPIPVRYIKWVGNILKGDLGESVRFSLPVYDLIKTRLPVTFSLMIISILITLAVGIPLGILSAKYNNRIGGFFINFITQIFLAIPSFWVGIMLIMIFGVILKWFSPGGYVSWSENPAESIKSVILPSVAIALPNIAIVIRYLKNSVLEQMKKDYVRMAYSKGLNSFRVMKNHVIRNAVIPVITVLGMIISSVLAGSLIVEQVFTLPGIGRLLISAIGNRDLPLVEGMILYISFTVLFINFIIDILYKFIDPRIKYD
ncbi:MAG TPA: ABC transporter permease [Tepiditoga sp.]|nr:ABC transporter permease [Thermotogota bacterium]HOO75099.1 ABC transporter permease [Tepiditoga sp.]